MLSTLLLLSCALVGQTENEATPNQPAAASDDAVKPADKGDLAARVKRLIRQLDADELAQRQQAEKDLASLGPEILSLLPDATARTSAEVKVRLGRVRRKLEQGAATQSATASRVTLKGKMTLAEALAAIEKQTGNKASGVLNEDLEVDVDFKDTPYWEALDHVLDQAGLSINHFGGRFNELTLTSRPDSEGDRVGTAAYGSLFRFEAIRIISTRSLRNPGVQGMRVALEICWEPRLTPISIVQSVSKLTATDENGNEIAFDTQRQTLEAGPTSDVSAVELEVPLGLPPRSVSKIASFKGEMTALIPGRTASFEFADLESGRRAESSRAGVTVFLDNFRKNRALHEIRMRLRYDLASNALESHRGWVYNNEAYILDADGNKIENIGFEATYQGVNEVGFVYRFVLEEGPKGCRFVYKAPSAIIRLPIQYELKDIALP